jgi:hypothetical protein
MKPCVLESLHLDSLTWFLREIHNLGFLAKRTVQSLPALSRLRPPRRIAKSEGAEEVKTEGIERGIGSEKNFGKDFTARAT